MRRWVLSEADGRLVCEDRAVQLTAKAAAVLALLARRSGEAVTRDTILREIWGGVTVSPDLVRDYVADIRAALGDDAAAPSYVETLRGRGVRLIGGVELAPPSARPSPRPCVAVLRPDVYVAGERWRLIGDALGEELITELARAPDLAVIARHSSFAVPPGADLRAASTDLGARWLIEIGLTEGDGRIRTHSKLIDGESGAVSWYDRLDLPLDALPSLVGETAVRTAGAVAGWGGKVHAVERAAAARRPSASRDAYQDYLIAVELEHGGTVGALREAIAHVDRALARDPGFARAWLVSYFSWSQLANRTAGAEALRALRKSLRAIDRAFALDPHDPMIVACYAYGCGRRGDLVAAANWAMRACDIGWNDAGAATVAANALIAMVGDFDRAREMLDRAGRLDPNPPAWRRFAAARLAFFTGEFARVATIAEGDRGHALLAGLRVLALAMLDRPEAVAAEADFDARFGAGALDRLADAQCFAAAATLARWREAMERLRALRKPMSVHRPCRS